MATEKQLKKKSDRHKIASNPIKKKWKDDPYLRAYNYMASRRHIIDVENFFGEDRVEWWMRFGTMVLQVVTIVLLLLLILLLC